MSKTMVQFVKDNMIDPNLVGQMINDRSKTGVDIMEYIHQRIPMTKEQKNRMVDMRSYGTIIDSKLPDDKKRILQALVRMLNR